MKRITSKDHTPEMDGKVAGDNSRIYQRAQEPPAKAKDLCECGHAKVEHCDDIDSCLCCHYKYTDKDDVECTCEIFTPQNPNLNFKDTSLTWSLGERESSNTQHQVEGNETTTVSLAGQGKAPAPVYSPQTKDSTLKSVVGSQSARSMHEEESHKTVDTHDKTFKEELKSYEQQRLALRNTGFNIDRQMECSGMIYGMEKGRELTLREVSAVIRELGEEWEIPEESNAISGEFSYSQFKDHALFKELKEKLSALSGEKT